MSKCSFLGVVFLLRRSNNVIAASTHLHVAVRIIYTLDVAPFSANYSCKS